MHFEIPRKELLNPLKMVVSVVEQRQTMPILGNVLVSVADNVLSLTATDAEVEISCRLPLETRLGTDDDGATTIPARKFFDICRSLSEQQPIQITTENDRVLIRSGRSRFTLSTLPAADFPVSSENPNMLSLNLPQSVLRELIAQTSFCAAVADVRYYLNGLLFDLMPSKLSVVATDGHRLALATREYQLPEQPLQVIIPRKAVLELSRTLDNVDDEVKITLDQTHIRFEISDQLTLTSKLIDGRFPDYYGVLPHNPDKIVVATCDVLKQALARVAILSNEKYKGVRLNIKAGMLALSARNPEQEEAEEELEIEYDGESFEIGFNVNYLTDALNAIPTEKVELCFSDPNSSCLVKPQDSDQQKYVVMPMRL